MRTMSGIFRRSGFKGRIAADIDILLKKGKGSALWPAVRWPSVVAADAESTVDEELTTFHFESAVEQLRTCIVTFEAAMPVAYTTRNRCWTIGRKAGKSNSTVQCIERWSRMCSI